MIYWVLMYCLWGFWSILGFWNLLKEKQSVYFFENGSYEYYYFLNIQRWYQNVFKNQHVKFERIDITFLTLTKVIWESEWYIEYCRSVSVWRGVWYRHFGFLSNKNYFFLKLVRMNMIIFRIWKDDIKTCLTSLMRCVNESI